MRYKPKNEWGGNHWKGQGRPEKDSKFSETESAPERMEKKKVRLKRVEAQRQKGKDRNVKKPPQNEERILAVENISPLEVKKPSIIALRRQHAPLNRHSGQLREIF